MTQTLAHVSDLHFGLGRHEHAAAAVVQQLLRASVDHVIVSGDVTHRGRAEELERFSACFAPLRAVARVSVALFPAASLMVPLFNPSEVVAT